MITRQTELSYFFMVMGNLAAAKAANDLEGVSECIDDLEGMVLHSDTARIRRVAAAEAEHTSALLAELQAKRCGYTGPVAVTIRADVPANLN